MIPSKFIPKNSKLNDLLSSIQENKNLSVLGLNLGERVLVSSFCNDFVCYIVENEEQGQQVVQDLTSLGKRVAYISKVNDDYTFHLMEFGDKNITEQVELYKIVQGQVEACVVLSETLYNRYAPIEIFKKGIFDVSKGQNIEITDFIKKLIDFGYSRVDDSVSENGNFAVRGDVVDVFPINSPLPYRLYFFDTEIEKITTFNILSQYSIEQVDNFTIFANSFALDDSEIALIKQTLQDQYYAMQKRIGKAKNPHEFMQAVDNLKVIGEGITKNISRSAWAYVSAFTQSGTIFSLLPKNTKIFIDQPKQCFNNLSNIEQNIKDNINDNIEAGLLTSLHKNLMPDFDVIKGEIAKFGAVCFQSLMVQNKFFDPQKIIEFSTLPLPKLNNDYQNFAVQLEEFVNQKYIIILTAQNSTNAQEFYAKLSKHIPCENVVKAEDALLNRVNIIENPLYLGACFVEEKILLLGSRESKFVRQKSKEYTNQMVRATDTFTLPEVGEYVVHATYGIGVCEGITQLSIGGAKRDYIIVGYNNNDRLYVPTEQLDMLGRYVGGEKSPKLSTIGSNAFEKVKQKVREGVKALAFDLLKLYREREKSKGIVMSVDESSLDEFERSFAYKPTQDQVNAFNDVYRDLASGRIMDRLIVGDVGYGKTEVAIRASFVAVMSGYQVAIIVPTTILSEQHYNTFASRLKNYGFEIRCLNRFKSLKEQKQILEDVKSGKVNILIGTHRLLSKDVEFDHLGLLVVDEEQRFGVGDKEKLKNIKKNIHVLTLSATPIPRTLHLSLAGIRDISTIETPPLDRLPVQTVISQFSYNLISTAIKREFNRGGQTLVVYPRIEHIEEFASSLRAELGHDVVVAVAHGQMDKDVIEDTIIKLYQGQIDVLVATTLIENGIDLPNANTLFVVAADLLGLSQLYQLKGRVGRSDKLAYAYFTYNDEGKLTNSAYERLSVLMQFTALGSGFKVAMRDLELRGAGNILGAEQHGQMEKVGYDLYCKILDSSIKEANGEVVKEFTPVKIEVDIDAFVPDSFETDKIRRMEIYSIIANITSDQDAVNVENKIKDSYGYIPDSISGLIKVALLKAKCQQIGFERVSVTKEKTSFYIAQDNVSLLNKIEVNLTNEYMVYKRNSWSIITHINQNMSTKQIYKQVFEFLNNLILKI